MRRALEVSLWIGGLALLAWGAWATWSSTTFVECVRSAETPNAGQQGEQRSWIVIRRHCTWAAIRGNRESINAVSTLTIAGFTVLLGIATVLTLTHLRESSRRELRAYLEVDFPLYPNTEGVNKYDVVIDVTNHGQTPARKVRLSAWYEVAKTTTSHDYARDPKLRAEMHDGPQPCAPGTGVASQLRLGIRPRPADHEKIGVAYRGGAENFYYVFGTLDYEDIFGNAQRTHFCARYVAEPNDRVDTYGWVACDCAEHNLTT